MRPSPPAADKAILANFRDVSTTVSINGSSTQWPATEFQTDAQTVEKPLAVSTLGGVAARQVHFKIDHTYAQAISPYQPSLVPAALPIPMGAVVVVSINFWPGPSRSGTPTYSAVIFTGNVIDIPVVDGLSDITVWAQDASYNLGTLVSLPAAGVVGSAGLDRTADLYYSSLMPIDLLLRGCGQYLTAPPVLTGKAYSAYTILSIPGVGGNVPDVGGVIAQYKSNSGSYIANIVRTPGHFTPDVVGSNGAIYSQTVNMLIQGASPFTLYRIDTWFRTNGTSGATIINGAYAKGGDCPTVTVGGDGNVATSASSGTGVTTSGVNVLDGQWHHLNVTYSRPNPTTVTATISIDGRYFSSTTAVAANLILFPGGTLVGDPGTWFVVGGDGSSTVIWLEALEVIFVPLSATYTDPPDRNAQAPGIASSITATATRLQALAPQSGINAWQTIQAIASAEGALCWFDEDRRFFFEPQSVWLRRRTAPPVRTFDPTMFSNLSLQVNADGLRKTVTANYQTVTAAASTVAVPAYVATTVLTFAPGQSFTQITTPQLFFNPAPFATGASNALGNSWNVPVDAGRVGDPAAPIVAGVGIIVAPTSVGFNIAVFNPTQRPIAFWNPTPGTIPQGPALIIHGTSINISAPLTASYTDNTHAKDDLHLPDNPWRQDAAAAWNLCHITAHDTYNVIPSISNIDVPGDPRLQLGDLIVLTDNRSNSLIRTPGGIRCVVVDIAHNVSASADYRMTLAIRPVGPPTGWILGVPGRSELASTTYLPLPG